MKKKVVEGLFVVPTLVLFSLFFIFPAGRCCSSQPDRSSGGITVENYTSIITNTYYRRAMWNSIWLSLVVTAVTLVIAGVIAFFLARTEFKGKNLYMTDNISQFLFRELLLVL